MRPGNALRYPGDPRWSRRQLEEGPRNAGSYWPEAGQPGAFGRPLRFAGPGEFTLDPDLADSWEQETRKMTSKKGVKFHNFPPVNG